MSSQVKPEMVYRRTVSKESAGIIISKKRAYEALPLSLLFSIFCDCAVLASCRTSQSNAATPTVAVVEIMSVFPPARSLAPSSVEASPSLLQALFADPFAHSPYARFASIVRSVQTGANKKVPLSQVHESDEKPQSRLRMPRFAQTTSRPPTKRRQGLPAREC